MRCTECSSLPVPEGENCWRLPGPFFGGWSTDRKRENGKGETQARTQHAEPKGEGVDCYGNRRHLIPLMVLKLSGLNNNNNNNCSSSNKTEKILKMLTAGAPGV